jgi:hypothetical protein
MAPPTSVEATVPERELVLAHRVLVRAEQSSCDPVIQHGFLVS